MKRMLAGVQLLIGLGAGTLGVGTMFAEDGFTDRSATSGAMRRRSRMTAGNCGALSTTGIMRLPA